MSPDFRLHGDDGIPGEFRHDHLRIELAAPQALQLGLFVFAGVDGRCESIPQQATSLVPVTGCCFCQAGEHMIPVAIPTDSLSQSIGS